MTFSPELEARFAKMLESYPPGRTRSAVVPMLLYAQDEVGHISNELIEEVARRCSVQPLQVDEVVGYYSMLHRKPLGKCHVQVCTNISCLILGGEELYEHASQDARDRPQRSDAGRAVFARRSGMHGRVQLGAGDPAQLRFPSPCDAGEAGSTAR